jgi:hypothetical protein
MSTLRIYRDDGLLATALGRRVGAAVPLGPLGLTLLGAAPLLVVLVAWRADLPPAGAGLAAVAFLIVAAGSAGPRAAEGRLAWTVPPLLRLLEYAVAIRLTVLADRDALPLCFALLGVLAFHHYDVVYRVRHQGAPPPAWTSPAGGGWDGRLLLVYVLAVAGALGPGLLAAALALAALYVGESIASWVRFERAATQTVYEDEDVADE